MTDELYYDAFRRQERLRERLESEREVREELIARSCTFRPKLARDSGNEPVDTDDVTARLYEEHGKKSVKMQKLVERLQKKELMHQPTFRPKLSKGEEGDEETNFDVEKLVERLFQSGKELQEKRERNRNKYYKTTCPFKPNLARKGKEPEEQASVEDIVARLYEEEVKHRKEMKALNLKKLRRAEGLTFQPNWTKASKQKLTPEETEALVTHLWQEAKDRQARVDFTKSKEEKRLKKTIGIIPPDIPRRKRDPAEEFDAIAHSAKLYDERVDRQNNLQKLINKDIQLQLQACNNYSPKIKREQIEKVVAMDKFQRWGRSPLSPVSPQRPRSKSAGYVHPLEPTALAF